MLRTLLSLLGLLSCSRASPPPALVVPPVTDDGCAEPWTPSLEGRFRLSSYPGQDEVGPSGARPMPMSKEYTFTADHYVLDAYPPLTVTGRYTLLAAEGPRLHVRFTETIFDGHASPDRDLWLTFSQCGAVLELDGMTYTRIPAAPPSPPKSVPQ